jgi:hypothetical protein
MLSAVDSELSYLEEASQDVEDEDEELEAARSSIRPSTYARPPQGMRLQRGLERNSTSVLPNVAGPGPPAALPDPHDKALPQDPRASSQRAHGPSEASSTGLPMPLSFSLPGADS